MKFGHEYEQALANEHFPEQWLGSAIDYKYLKKCIKKVHRELQGLGLHHDAIAHLMASMDPTTPKPMAHGPDYFSAALPSLAAIPEEFTPQLRVLVDSRTGNPLDAQLAPETRDALQKLAKTYIIPDHHEHGGLHHVLASDSTNGTSAVVDTEQRKAAVASVNGVPESAKWVQIPLASAQHFFNLLEPKLQALEALRKAETEKLEEEILDLGEAIEDVVEPVREGFEARRKVSYRDLYFWREMFRLYMETPIFYSNSGKNRGALTFADAKQHLEDYDAQLRSTGLLAKMQTPEAQQAAQKFLNLNVEILRIMHFQEMNARAMKKILKKFDKQTHLEAQMFVKSLRKQYPLLLPTNDATQAATTGGFASSIARDVNAEILTKLLQIVPQPDDWLCPVCSELAWRPVDLGCCRARFCIRCVIELQERDETQCPCCHRETVMAANGRNLDFEAMDFLEKYFPLEVKKRQKENDRLQLKISSQDDAADRKSGCCVM